jgi:hypothetical protein
MRKKTTVVVLSLLGTFGVIWLFAAGGNGAARLSVAFSHYETNGDYRVGVVRVTNRGSGAACFEGYSKDAPLYRMMVQAPEGWREQSIGWCGMGAGQCTLAAGSTVTFQVILPANQNWKAGLSYYTPTTYERLPGWVRRWFRPFGKPPQAVMAWSEGVSP